MEGSLACMEQDCSIANSGRDCQGDSGGPIFKETSEGVVLIGVVSRGFEYCYQNLRYPSFFERIAYYIPWIQASFECFVGFPVFERKPYSTKYKV